MAAHGVVVDILAQVSRFAQKPRLTIELQVGEPAFNVCTVSRNIVPAFIELLIPVSVPVRIPPGFVGVVEPPLHACTVLVARGVCAVAFQTVLLANPTLTLATLESGATVGRLTLLSEAHTEIHRTPTLSTAASPMPSLWHLSTAGIGFTVAT